jgi:IclR family acetate operon transcriptional repressor
MSATGVNSSAIGRGSASSEVAERTLDVLSCFLASSGDLGVTEIANRVGIEKSRVHRFLVALRRKGYVLDNPRTRRYSLGFRALELGRALARQMDLERQAEPVLRELADRIEETTGLATAQACRRVHLMQVESRHEIKLSFVLSTPLPLHLGAAGKTLLAFLTDADRELCLARSVAAGPPLSEEALATLKSELSLIRRAGYGASAGERVPGSRSIAAPVWTWRGDLLVLVTSGPAARFTKPVATQAVPLLREAASRLTRELGGNEYAAEVTVGRVV